MRSFQVSGVEQQAQATPDMLSNLSNPKTIWAESNGGQSLAEVIKQSHSGNGFGGCHSTP